MNRFELETLIKRRGVHPIFGSPGEDDYFIEQSPFELSTFLDHCLRLGVQSCLEIGTGHRSGLSRFLANDLGWDVTSIDVNNYHHVYPNIHYIVLARPDEIVLFSHQFDLVFIDGDHAYECVKRDYEHYAPLADKVIAFHDIAGLRDCEGVKRFWDELSNTQNDFIGSVYEILDKPERRAGIGYLVRAELTEPERTWDDH